MCAPLTKMFLSKSAQNKNKNNLNKNKTKQNKTKNKTKKKKQKTKKKKKKKKKRGLVRALLPQARKKVDGAFGYEMSIMTYDLLVCTLFCGELVRPWASFSQKIHHTPSPFLVALLALAGVQRHEEGARERLYPLFECDACAAAGICSTADID